MPTLVFSAMLLLLQGARNFVEEIGNQLLGAHEPVRTPFVGFVTVPMVEGRLPPDKPAATVRNPVGIVVAHQPPTIRGVEGQRIGNTMRLLWRRRDPLDFEPRYESAVVDDLLAVEVE